MTERNKHTGGKVTANKSRISLSTRTGKTTSTGGSKSNVKKGGKKKHTGLRAHSEEAEFKYQSISSGMARKLYMGEIFAKQVRTHLQKEYRNEAETEALLKLQGGIDALSKIGRMTATKEDQMRYWHIAEKMRLDKKMALTKAEGATAFALGRAPKKMTALPRPSEFQAKDTTPYYPRKGSSKGNMKTIQRGAVRTNKAWTDFMNAIFRLGGDKPRASIKRTITKTLK